MRRGASFDISFCTETVIPRRSTPSDSALMPIVVLMQVPRAVATRSVGEKAAPFPLLSAGASVAIFDFDGPWVASQCRSPVYLIEMLTIKLLWGPIRRVAIASYHPERSEGSPINSSITLNNLCDPSSDCKIPRSSRNDQSPLVLRNDGYFLNFIGVLREFFAKNTGQISVVKNDHVSIVFFGVVVLPAFVPPAEADDCRPSIGK